MKDSVEKKLELCREIIAQKGRCSKLRYYPSCCGICPILCCVDLTSDRIIKSAHEYITANMTKSECYKFSIEELWDKIQEIRQLVGSDGTRDICDDIKSYAENYNSVESNGNKQKITESIEIPKEYREYLATHMEWYSDIPEVRDLLSPLSKREQIAAMAMQGVIISMGNTSAFDGVVSCAIRYTDALINKLEETK